MKTCKDEEKKKMTNLQGSKESGQRDRKDNN